MQIYMIADSLWAGTSAAMWNQLRVEEQVAQGAFITAQPEAEMPESRLLQVQAGVGVIGIKGTLVNNDSWMNRFMGRTGYNEIREAIIEAVSNPSIKAILFDVDSPGGSVAGLSDTADLMKEVRRVKPTFAFAGGNMASAAYWLGASAGKVFASKASIVGSIGVMSVHLEYSKQLAQSGVGATIVRSGQFKALANSIEPLSAEAEGQEQAKSDAAYKVFVDHVAEARGTTSRIVLDRMAEGREFVGEAAKEAGLIDGITTFDKLMSKIQAELLDTPSFPTNNSVNSIRGQFMPKALTEQELAALASGSNPQASAQSPADESDSPPVDDAAPAESPAPSAGTPPAAAPGPSSDVVDLLNKQLASSQSALVAAQVEVAQLGQQLAALSASMKPLVEIAAGSISNMRVALSLAPVDFRASKPEEVVAQHAEAVALFNKQFRAGGVASAPVQKETNKPEATPGWLRPEYIQATTFQKR